MDNVDAADFNKQLTDKFVGYCVDIFLKSSEFDTAFQEWFKKNEENVKVEFFDAEFKKGK